jgi:hypothetical protein
VTSLHWRDEHREHNAVQLRVLTAGYIYVGGEVTLRAPEVRSYHVDIPLSGRAINSWDDGRQEMATAQRFLDALDGNLDGSRPAGAPHDRASELLSVCWSAAG